MGTHILYLLILTLIHNIWYNIHISNIQKISFFRRSVLSINIRVLNEKLIQTTYVRQIIASWVSFLFWIVRIWYFLSLFHILNLSLVPMPPISSSYGLVIYVNYHILKISNFAFDHYINFFVLFLFFVSTEFTRDITVLYTTKFHQLKWIIPAIHTLYSWSLPEHHTSAVGVKN